MISISGFLSEIPATVYVGFFTAITTLTGVFLTNKANNQRLKIQYDFETRIKQQDIMREKLEELYFLSSRFIKNISVTYTSWGYFIGGVTNMSDVVKTADEIAKNSIVEQEKIEMLIKFYFPELEDNYKIFEESKKKVNSIWLDFTSKTSEYRKNKSNKDIVDYFSKYHAKFILQSNTFLKTIANKANKYQIYE